MEETHEKWRCRGCDGECVLIIYPNNIKPRTCIYTEDGESVKDIAEWEKIDD